MQRCLDTTKRVIKTLLIFSPAPPPPLVALEFLKFFAAARTSVGARRRAGSCRGGRTSGPCLVSTMDSIPRRAMEPKML